MHGRGRAIAPSTVFIRVRVSSFGSELSFSPRKHAERLASLGFNVLPARLKDKKPSVEWVRWQDQAADQEQRFEWFPDIGSMNYWIACGKVSGGLVVADADSLATVELWEKLFPEEMSAAFCDRTAKGLHVFFHCDEPIKPWSFHPKAGAGGGLTFDIRGEGSGVIGPKSVHESGVVYAWDRERGRPDDWASVELPEALKSREKWLALLKKSGIGVGVGVGAGGGVGGGTGEAGIGNDDTEGGTDGLGGDEERSTLASLLRNKPEAEGEGRNVWLSRVCGHYAKMIPHRDGYMATVLGINAGLAVPLGAGEARKTADSIWRTEQRGREEEQDEEGVSDLALDHVNNRIVSKIWDKAGGGWVPYAWANFRPVVTTLFTGSESDGGDIFDLELFIGVGSVGRRLILKAADCGNSRSLNGRLASVGATIDQIVGDSGRPEARFVRLLNGIAEKKLEAVTSLGWDDREKGVVVFEGTITPKGLREARVCAPRPGLKRLAAYKYGWSEEGDTREALREVLTFQDEKVAGVFGSWWAACMLAPQVLKKIGYFPFMALEAPSESGKTRGFFNLMTALSGGLGGGVLTTAALRDAMSATAFGIVWVDDMQRPDEIFELIRGGGGFFTKKGVDLSDNVSVKVQAPLLLSGESLGLQEKAMRDRSIRLDVSSPTGRMSLKKGMEESKQWVDVVAFMDANPELWRFAGTLVMLALRERKLVDQLLEWRLGSGRVADSVAVLRMGARLLDRLVGNESGNKNGSESRSESGSKGRWTEVVDRWVEDDMDREEGNLLTTKILPDLLVDAAGGIPRSSRHGPPLFIDPDGIMWISLAKVSSRWLSLPGQRGDIRAKAMGSIDSLKDQVRQTAGNDSVARKMSTLPGRARGIADTLVRYWAIPVEEARAIQRRAGIGVSYSRETAAQDGST